MTMGRVARWAPVLIVLLSWLGGQACAQASITDSACVPGKYDIGSAGNVLEQYRKEPPKDPETYAEIVKGAIRCEDVASLYYSSIWLLYQKQKSDVILGSTLLGNLAVKGSSDAQFVLGLYIAAKTNKPAAGLGLIDVAKICFDTDPYHHDIDPTSTSSPFDDPASPQSQTLKKLTVRLGAERSAGVQQYAADHASEFCFHR